MDTNLAKEKKWDRDKGAGASKNNRIASVKNRSKGRKFS